MELGDRGLTCSMRELWAVHEEVGGWKIKSQVVTLAKEEYGQENIFEDIR